MNFTCRKIIISKRHTMRIDFHTHCFPEKIAEKAKHKLSKASGGLIPQTDLTADGLRREMKKDGIDISVVMNIATNPHQQHSVNDFAASQISSDLVPFGSVHPDSPDALEELERIKALGMKGVKFHPEYQNFYVDDEKMFPIYRKINELGLITLFHAGGDIGFAPPYHGTPERFLKIIPEFDTPLVLAHWGGCFMCFEVLEKLAGAPVWFDTSFGYSTMPREIALRILEKHGTDRLLLGSDMPWQRPSWSLALLDSLDLSEEETELIESKNAQKLLGL